MAGIHLHRSNRVEVLVEILAAALREPGDPFEPVQIAVGSRGMERYLRQALAERLGICANVAFPFPAAALDGAVDGALAQSRDPWSPAVLTWALLDLLPGVAAEPGCEPLAAYLGGTGGPIDAREIGLATRVADLFDRYVTWRPELALGWSAGESAVEPGARWQAALWRALAARRAGPHRAERLAAAAPRPGAPLRFFAISTLPPAWLEALARIATRRDVELYLLCPSDAYWADTRAGGHPLLHSWGRVARDLQHVLGGLPDGSVHSGTDFFIEPDAATALGRLQADLRAAVAPRAAGTLGERPPLDPADRSIQFHDCHGASRQVEVLRDVLLGLLDADPTLQPRDIVVMTPDLETFAPRFAAVFDRGEHAPGESGEWGRSGTPKLPYEIADLTVRRLNPVADALLRLLDLSAGRAGASAVLDLLALEPVAARFDLEPDEVARLRDWVAEAGICWASDAGHRARHDQPADGQNTWRFGLDRLLMGAMARDDGQILDGVRPCEVVEGAETRLLGSLCEFTAALFSTIDALQAPRPVAAWVEALGSALAALTRADDRSGARSSATASWLGRAVREALALLAEEAEGAERAVAASGIRAALEGRFGTPGAAIQGAGGAITLCGMVPERAVPHRVVCLLGLDDAAFPRVGGRPAFDLARQSPRPGDRNPRDEDQYLLLEAVLSARSHLVVTYTGRDPHTNARKPPAVPVSELRDALDAMWPWSADRPSALLTTEHVLQAFDPRNFDPAPTPRTFDRRLLGSARAATLPRGPRPPFLGHDLPAREADADRGPIALEDLRRFWMHPVRSFVRRRFGLWLPFEASDEVVDREPITFDWVGQAEMLREILDGRRSGSELGALRATFRASGRLPLGRAGDVAFDTSVALADRLLARARAVGWDPRVGARREIDVAVGGARLVGAVPDATDAGLVVFAYGAERPIDLLFAWIHLLARLAADPDSPTRARIFFGKVKTDGDLECGGIGLDAAKAGDALADLVGAYRAGRSSPLPYHPKSSIELAKHAWGTKGLFGDARRPEVVASGAWTADARAVLLAAAKRAAARWSEEEAKDRYNRHVFGSAIPFLDRDGSPDPAFAALAGRIWAPILAARHTEKVMEKWT